MLPTAACPYNLIMLTLVLQRWPQCHALGRSRATLPVMAGLRVAHALGREA